MASAPLPPPYIQTAFDETLRSKSYLQPFIGSMANRPNLIGKLEHHSGGTDGSFSICIAGGEGVFISKALLESIPAPHRPALDTTIQADAGTLTSGTLKAIGTTFIPFLLTNRDTGEKFRIVLYAIVLPDLFMSMFIGGPGESGDLVQSIEYRGGPSFGLRLGESDNDLTYVKGI